MMQLRLSLLVLFLLTLFLQGCGSDKKSVFVPKKTLPEWYKSPPLSDDETLYAIGEGKTKEDAIANGLSMMISTLSVSLSSDFRAKTIVQEGRTNSAEARYESDIKSSVKEIRISNYELLNADSLGFRKYAVLLRSKKGQLFESMLEETQQEFALLDEKERRLQGENGLKKIAFYKEALSKLSTLPNRLIVMGVLNSFFESAPYLAKFQAYESAYEQTLRGLTFFVSTSQNINNLQRVVEKGLSQEKITIASEGEANMHFHVHLDANIQEANSYGFSLARSEINVVTKDSNGVTVGTNRLSIIGQSSQGYAVAKQNLAIKLSEQIKKEGIAQVLGLNI